MNLLDIINKLNLDTIDQEEFLKPALRRNLFKKAGDFTFKAALTSAPFFLMAMPRIAKAQTTSVVDVLQFALTLEYLEAEFYDTAVAATALIPSTDLPVFQQIQKHEKAHVAFLQTAIQGLGATPAQKPTFDYTAKGNFTDVFTNYQTFLAVSQAFEDTGVRAYKGQAGNLINSDDILTAALRIHSVEARHAAQVRRMRGERGWITGSSTTLPAIAAPVYAGEENVTHEVSTGTFNASTDLPTLTPPIEADSPSESFDEPLSKEAVMQIVAPFIAA